MTEHRDHDRVHHRACNLCEAICGLEIRVAGDEILSIRPDDADPLSQGHICPKAVALKDLHADPDRLRRPIRRTAEGWVEMEWDAAFDLVAEKAWRRRRAARRRRGRQLPRQSDRAQLRRPHPRSALPVDDQDQEPLLGDLGRPAAAPAHRLLDVRSPAAGADRRHRPLRLPAGARGQPDGLQRQPDDGAGVPEAAESHAGARWAHGGDRSAAQRDRRGRRRAPVHPPRHRCRVSRCAAQGDRLREPRRSRPAGRLHRRLRCGDGRDRRARCPSARRPLRHRGADHRPHRPRARRRRARLRLRPHGRVDAGARHAVPVADPAAEHRHRQSRSRGRGNVHAAGRRSHRQPDLQARQLRPLDEPGARPAGVRWRTAGRRARRGNPDAG